MKKIRMLLAMVALLTFMVVGVAQAADKLVFNKEYGIKVAIPEAWTLEDDPSSIISAECEYGMFQVYSPKQQLPNISDMSQLNDETRQGYARVMGEGFAKMGLQVSYNYGTWKNRNVLILILNGQQEGKEIVGLCYSLIKDNKNITFTVLGEKDQAKVQVLQNMLDSVVIE